MSKPSYAEKVLSNYQRQLSLLELQQSVIDIQIPQWVLTNLNKVGIRLGRDINSRVNLKVRVEYCKQNIALWTGIRIILPNLNQDDLADINFICTANHTLIYSYYNKTFLEISREAPYKWRILSPDHLSTMAYIEDCGYYNVINQL